MNQREKTLLLAIVAVLVIAGGFYGMRSVAESFRKRQADIDRISGEIERENVTVLGGLRAAEEMAYLEQRALSDDPEEAQRLYKDWVADWAERNQLEDLKLKVDSARNKVKDQKLLYRTHSFTIAGRTDLRKLTQLLYEFETAKQLHRMRTLNITPLGEKELDVFMSIDALALPDAMDRREIDEDQELAAKTGPLEDLQRTIFNRNLFGPENNAPSLDIDSSYTVNLGDSLDLKLDAQDRDEVDNLSFSADLENLPGAELQSGTVRWRPEELGDYIAEVEVMDDGFPALSDRLPVQIRVVEPPPPSPPEPRPEPPRFDYAKYTQLTAIIIKSGVPTAWLWVRPTDEQLKVNVGDEFAIGDMSGKITSMEFDSVTFQSDGRLYRMGMRDFVGRAQDIGEVEQPVSQETAEPEQTPDDETPQRLPPLESPEETAVAEAPAESGP